MFENDKPSRVNQVAKRRNLSPDTIRRLFRDEPGVIRIKRGSQNRRCYEVILIPPDIEGRVFQRFTNGGRV